MSRLAIHENKIYSLGDNAVYTIPTAILPLPTLWLRADAGVEADGDNLVSEWQDQSGNGYDTVQSNQANKPLLVDSELNGKPVLRFSGDYMKVNFGQTFSQPNTFFVVYRYINVSGAKAVFDGINSTNRNYLGMTSASSDIVLFSGSARLAQSKTLEQFTTPVLNTVIYNSPSTKLYENGFEVYTGDTGTQSLAGLTIGARYSNDQLLDGDIAEIIFYNSLLSDQQRQSVEQYLMTKYAL